MPCTWPRVQYCTWTWLYRTWKNSTLEAEKKLECFFGTERRTIKPPEGMYSIPVLFSKPPQRCSCGAHQNGALCTLAYEDAPPYRRPFWKQGLGRRNQGDGMAGALKGLSFAAFCDSLDFLPLCRTWSVAEVGSSTKVDMKLQNDI